MIAARASSTPAPPRGSPQLPPSSFARAVPAWRAAVFLAALLAATPWIPAPNAAAAAEPESRAAATHSRSAPIGNLRVSLLDRDGGDPARPDNLRLRIELPAGYASTLSKLRARHFRVFVFPETLDDADGLTARYRAEGLFLWRHGERVFLDVRRPPAQDNAGRYKVAACLAPSGETVFSGTASERLRYETGSVDVVLVVDISKSMNANDPRGRRYEAARAFARAAAEGGRIGRVGLVRFNHRPEIVLPLLPVDDADTFDRALHGWKNSGLTNLDDALEAALMLLSSETANDGRRGAVILLTDGKNEGTRYRETHRLAGAVGVPVYAVGLGRGTDRELLRRMAEETGGISFDAETDRELLGIYQWLAASIGKRPLLARETADASGLDYALPVDETVRRLFVFSDGQTPVRAASPSGRSVAGRVQTAESRRDAVRDLDIDVPLPEPGDWRLYAAPGDARSLVASADTSLFPEVFPPQIVDRRLHVAVSLASAGEAVKGARIWIPSISGNPEILLVDDGKHGDGDADDGVYGATMDIPDGVTGTLNLSIAASGATSGGWPFKRLLAGVSVIVPPARAASSEPRAPEPKPDPAPPSEPELIPDPEPEPASTPPPAPAPEIKTQLAARPARIDLGTLAPGESTAVAGQLRYQTATPLPVRFAMEQCAPEGFAAQALPAELEGKGQADWRLSYTVPADAVPGSQSFGLRISLGTASLVIQGAVTIAQPPPAEPPPAPALPEPETPSTPEAVPEPESEPAFEPAMEPMDEAPTEAESSIPPAAMDEPATPSAPEPSDAIPEIAIVQSPAPAIEAPPEGEPDNPPPTVVEPVAAAFQAPEPSTGPDPVMAVPPAAPTLPMDDPAPEPLSRNPDTADSVAETADAAAFAPPVDTQRATGRVWLGWLPYLVGCLLLLAAAALAAWWLLRRLWHHKAVRYLAVSTAVNVALLVLFVLALGGGELVALVKEPKLTARLVSMKSDFGFELTSDERDVLREARERSAIEVAESVGAAPAPLAASGIEAGRAASAARGDNGDIGSLSASALPAAATRLRRAEAAPETSKESLQRPSLADAAPMRRPASPPVPEPLSRMAPSDNTARATIAHNDAGSRETALTAQARTDLSSFPSPERADCPPAIPSPSDWAESLPRTMAVSSASAPLPKPLSRRDVPGSDKPVHLERAAATLPPAERGLFAPERTTAFSAATADSASPAFRASDNPSPTSNPATVGTVRETRMTTAFSGSRADSPAAAQPEPSHTGMSRSAAPAFPGPPEAAMATGLNHRPSLRLAVSSGSASNDAKPAREPHTPSGAVATERRIALPPRHDAPAASAPILAESTAGRRPASARPTKATDISPSTENWQASSSTAKTFTSSGISSPTSVSAATRSHGFPATPAPALPEMPPVVTATAPTRSAVEAYRVDTANTEDMPSRTPPASVAMIRQQPFSPPQNHFEPNALAEASASAAPARHASAHPAMSNDAGGFVAPASLANRLPVALRADAAPARATPSNLRDNSPAPVPSSPSPAVGASTAMLRDIAPRQSPGHATPTLTASAAATTPRNHASAGNGPATAAPAALAEANPGGATATVPGEVDWHSIPESFGGSASDGFRLPAAMASAQPSRGATGGNGTASTATARANGLSPAPTLSGAPHLAAPAPGDNGGGSESSLTLADLGRGSASARNADGTGAVHGGAGAPERGGDPDALREADGVSSGRTGVARRTAGSPSDWYGEAGSGTLATAGWSATTGAGMNGNQPGSARTASLAGLREAAPIVQGSDGDLLRQAFGERALADDGLQRVAVAKPPRHRGAATSAVDGIEAGLVVVELSNAGAAAAARFRRDIDARLAGRLRVDWRDAADDATMAALADADLLAVDIAESGRMTAPARAKVLRFADSGGLVWLDGDGGALGAELARNAGLAWSEPAAAWKRVLPPGAAMLWNGNRLMAVRSGSINLGEEPVRIKGLLALIGYLGAPGEVMASR